MNHLKNHLLFLTALALAGCAAPSVKEPPAPVVKAPVEVVVKAPDLPKVALTEPLLFEFLLAEIAGQRDQAATSAGVLLDMAKSTRDPRLARRATEMAVRARREDWALESAQLWLKLEPGETRARQMVVALLVNGGRLDEAKTYIETLLAGEGANIGNAFLYLHQTLSRQTDKASVLLLVQSLAKPYPEVAEAHFAIAQAAWVAERDELALQALDEASRRRPGWDAATLFRGQILQRTSPAEALALFKAYLNSFPKSQDVRLAYARLLITEKRYPEARAQFEQISGELPGSPEVSLALGLLSMQLKDFDAAERYLKQSLLERYRDENAVRMYLAQLYEERRQYGEAATWYASVVAGEHHLSAQMKHAAMLAKQGKLPESLQHLKQIVPQNNQQRAQLVMAEGQILRDAKAYRDAYDVLTRALGKLPNYPDLLYDHAMAAEKLGYFDVLEKDLRKLIQLKPDNAHAYNALGYSMAERGDRLEEASQLIEKALKLSPEDPFIMDSMGWVQYRLGQLEKAATYLKRAYANQPDAEIAAHLGEVLWVLERRDEAARLWQSALKENPEHEVLLNVIKKFKP